MTTPEKKQHRQRVDRSPTSDDEIEADAIELGIDTRSRDWTAANKAKRREFVDKKLEKFYHEVESLHKRVEDIEEERKTVLRDAINEWYRMVQANKSKN